MTSKSGGQDVRNRGRRGYGKAFDASCPNSSEKNAEKFAVLYSQNSVVVNPNKCDFSFETTSNGGRGGQAGKGRTDAHGASLLKQLQVKRVAEKLADQNNREVGAGRCKEDDKIDKSVFDISFKPTSNGGCGGQKDLQAEKVALKLALLDDNDQEEEAKRGRYFVKTGREGCLSKNVRGCDVEYVSSSIGGSAHQSLFDKSDNTNLREANRGHEGYYSKDKSNLTSSSGGANVRHFARVSRSGLISKDDVQVSAKSILSS